MGEPSDIGSYIYSIFNNNQKSASASEKNKLRAVVEAKARENYYNNEGAFEATAREIDKEAAEDHITSPQEAFGVDDRSDKPISCLYYHITSILGLGIN